MKVRDMPLGLQSALLNRGHDEDKDFTARQALAEWSIWELGDPYWGTRAVDYYELLTAKAEGE